MEEEIEKVASEAKIRFSDASWFKAGASEIIIGGAGGIGSYVAFFLSRIGHTIYIYDNDTVETVNFAGQLYDSSALGTNKAIATSKLCKAFTGGEAEITALPFLYQSDGAVANIMIATFDNMAARKLMFEKWKENEDREIFIDGRMSVENGQVFTVVKGNEEMYEKTLFDDSEIPDAVCSFKATSHCGAMIGSIITSSLNNYISNKFTGMDIREVNFRTNFELSTLTFDNEHNEE